MSSSDPASSLVLSDAINQTLCSKLPFDTEKDLRGMTLVGFLPQAFAAHPAAAATTLKEVLQPHIRVAS